MFNFVLLREKKRRKYIHVFKYMQFFPGEREREGERERKKENETKIISVVPRISQ